ncbi:MAG: hypothetical protein ABWZ25_17495 [Chitinophagaceae bacterium]
MVGIFPNLYYTVASYSPVTTFISFEALKAKDWQAALGQSTNWKHAEIRGIIHHETRHYVDHLSTLWGQTNLLSLYKAMNARLSLNETRFSEIINYKKQERELHFADYYHELYNGYVWRKGTANWDYRFSSGFRYRDDGSSDDTRPIMFVRFFTSDGLSLSRVPVSIASLFETNAVFQEVDVMGKYIASQVSNKELDKFNSWLMGSLIYNNDRTIYNVAGHICANLLDIKDPREAFPICSSLATLTLNLPHKLVEMLPLRDDELKVWNSRPRDMLRNHEHGFVFFNLLNNYKEKYRSVKRFNLQDLLAENGLPTEQEIAEMVRVELINLTRCYNEENLQRYFLDLHQKGLELFNLRGIDGSGYDISKILASTYIPNIRFADSKNGSRFKELFDVFKEMPLTDITHEDFFQIATLTDERMDSLFQIRGI